MEDLNLHSYSQMPNKHIYEKIFNDLDDAVSTLLNYDLLENDLLLEYPECDTFLDMLVGEGLDDSSTIYIIRLTIITDD